VTVIAPPPEAGYYLPTLHPRRTWHPPVLERLGPWRALTLQQSIPIGPGNSFLGPRTNGERLA